MIYTPMTEKALKLCFSVHKDQLDKSGLPYVFHPFHLAEQMKDELTVTLALLHDVVEDSDCTFEDLQKLGFPDEVLEPLRLLTHDPAVPYFEYIEAIKSDPAAVAVKLADLMHNSDRSRLHCIDEAAKSRLEKYDKALNILRA